MATLKEILENSIGDLKTQLSNFEGIAKEEVEKAINHLEIALKYENI
jgi:hypothetical protein